MATDRSGDGRGHAARHRANPFDPMKNPCSPPGTCMGMEPRRCQRRRSVRSEQPTDFGLAPHVTPQNPDQHGQATGRAGHDVPGHSGAADQQGGAEPLHRRRGKEHFRPQFQP